MAFPVGVLERRGATGAETATPTTVTGEDDTSPAVSHEHAQNNEALERTGHIVEQSVSPPHPFRRVATHRDA
ncbi:hypothetical protein [Kitasatospora sp. NPDC050463]|uniref:hypothetical protein n=1 Tax=Kitasatospora sp. NPDC050463 TaxID=3155786 RepID=UPI0033FCBDDC